MEEIFYFLWVGITQVVMGLVAIVSAGNIPRSHREIFSKNETCGICSCSPGSAVDKRDLPLTPKDNLDLSSCHRLSSGCKLGQKAFPFPIGYTLMCQGLTRPLVVSLQ